ncbi:MAG: hypothetical protein WCT25_03175 [Candidatus Paceibacterota bacterium]|jgi:hypothetical protein
MRYDSTKLNEIYKTLPKDVQEAMFSVDSANAVQKIGKDNGLMIDKMGTLGQMVGLVMLGVIKSVSFAKEIEHELGVNSTTAQKIVAQVNEQIFLPIRESLRKIQEKEIKPEWDSESTTTLNHEDVLKGIEEPGAVTADKQTLLSESKPATAPAPVNLPTGPMGNAPAEINAWPKSPEITKAPLETSAKLKVESMGVNILEDKMSKVVHIAKETKIIEPEPSKLPPVAPKPPTPPSMLKKQYGTVDPYREPVS